jgi:hypothetical protein
MSPSIAAALAICARLKAGCSWLQLADAACGVGRAPVVGIGLHQQCSIHLAVDIAHRALRRDQLAERDRSRLLVRAGREQLRHAIERCSKLRRRRGRH